MTEYFNFLGLPTVVQDLIAAEIVHNSIPQDWLQFALTCKAFNELVKHAQPKKILPSIIIGRCKRDGTISYFYSTCPQVLYRVYDDTTATEMEEWLRNTQIQILTSSTSIFSDEFKHHVEFLNAFYEATKFVTTLRILVSRRSSLNPGYLNFYEKLKHLKCLEFEGPFEDFVKLSKIPSNLNLRFYDADFTVLAEKLAAVQLSDLYFNQHYNKEEFQQLLKKTKFTDDAKVYFRFHTYKNDKCAVHMRYLGQDLFEIQCFSYRGIFLNISERRSRYCKQNERVLCLTKNNTHCFSFYVTTASSPNQPIFSSEMRDNAEFIHIEKIENADQNEWMKINVLYTEYRSVIPHYDDESLDQWFPRNQYGNPFERVETINKALGTTIAIIKPEMLVETLKKLDDGRLQL